MFDVIILAGHHITKKWSEAGNKALYNINGRIMIDYVIDAVKNARNIGRIIITGEKTQLQEALKDKVDAVLDANGSIVDNILAGIEYLGTDNKLLICSSDIPMLTAAAVNDFVNRSEALKADVCYPIVEKSVNESKYPGSVRTYVKLKEGTFTGGNIFYVDPVVVRENYVLANRLLNARKSPLKMAGILGIDFVFRFITGTLSISRVEKKFYKIIKIHGKAVISNYAEIGNDVDKPSDAETAKAYLS